MATRDSTSVSASPASLSVVQISVADRDTTSVSAGGVLSVVAVPTNSVAPAITGTATSGQTLTVSDGTWTGSPTYTYAWKDDGVAISGATAGTFLLTDTQIGGVITCTVTATNLAGSATATSAGTAAVASAASAAYAYTKFLASGNGTDAAIAFTEESSSARVLTFGGNAQIDTSIAPAFGTGWFQFDGTGDFIEVPGLDFHPDGPFVIEFRIRTATGAASQMIMGQWGAAGNRSWWVERFFADIRLHVSTNGTAETVFTVDGVAADTETYIRFERDASNNMRGWRNSTLEFVTTTLAGALSDSSAAVRMGSNSDTGGSDLLARVREIRLSDGSTNVHGSDTGFTAPTTAFPRT